MKFVRKIAGCLLMSILTLSLLTACSGETKTNLTWNTSRTKQYYESHGVTGSKISIEATIGGSGLQEEYFFTRDDECAYVKTKIGTQSQIWFTDADGYVYITTEGNDDWSRHKPDSDYGQYASLIRSGWTIPNEQNVAAISLGKSSLSGKEYTTETIRMNVNGGLANFIYYYGLNGLEFIESNGTIIKIISLSGTPTEDLLKVPSKWHNMG